MSAAVKRKLAFDSSDDIMSTLFNNKKKKKLKTSAESAAITVAELARQVYETLYRNAAATTDDDPAEIAIRKVKEIQDAMRFGYNGDASAFVSCPDDPMSRVVELGAYDLYLGKLAVDYHDVPRGRFLTFTDDVRLESLKCLPAVNQDRVGLDPATGRVLIEKTLEKNRSEEAGCVRKCRHYHIRVPSSRLWDARAAIYRLLHSTRSTTSNGEGPLDAWLKRVESDAPIGEPRKHNVDCLDMYYSDNDLKLCPWACSRFAQFVLVPLPGGSNNATIKPLLDDLLLGGYTFRPDVQFVFISTTTTTTAATDDDNDDDDDDDPRVIAVDMSSGGGRAPDDDVSTRPPETWAMPDKRLFRGRTLKRMFL